MLSVTAIQLDPQLVDSIDRIMWAQVVIAAASLVVALGAVGVAVFALIAVRRLSRLLHTLDRTVQGLAPRAEPILDQARRISEDLGEITGKVRDDLSRVHHAIEDTGRQLKLLSSETEDRLRQFGAVLQVVQDETQELLLDAAATARGLHTTAEALRSARRERPLRERSGAG